MCHATSFMRTRHLWCNRLGKVSNFTGSIALFSILSANLRFLTFLVLKFWFRALENVKWKSRNFVGFVSLTGWWAVTINESLPFGISLPLPAIIEIPLPALSSPVSRTPPAPCSPGLPPPCSPPLKNRHEKDIIFWITNNVNNCVTDHSPSDLSLQRPSQLNVILFQCCQKLEAWAPGADGWVRKNDGESLQERPREPLYSTATDPQPAIHPQNGPQMIPNDK